MRHLDASEIPEGWSLVTLGDAAEKILGGGTPPKANKDNYEGDIPWVTVKDLKSMFITDALDHITEEAISKSASNLIPAGNVILATRMAVGSAHLNTVDVAINQDLKAIFPKKDVSAKYLTYWLRMHSQTLALLGAGSTVKGLGLSQVRQLSFPKPPVAEQNAIVDILSSVDEALEASKAVLEQLKASRQGLIQKSFGDGIRYKFEGYIKARSVPFPEDWKIYKLRALCTRITDGVHQPVLTDSMGTVPFLYVSSIRPGKIIWERIGKITQKVYDEISKGRPPSNNVILYTAVGSYGNAVLLQNDAPVAFQRHIAYVAVDIKKAVPRFLELWLNSSFSRDFANRIAVGNAQKTVTLNELSNFPVFLPPMARQLEIIETLSSLDGRVRTEVERAQQLEVIKQGLMHQLLTGKLRVAVNYG